MIGFHWPELLVILVVGLLIFGPKRLPEISGGLGRGIRDFRRGLNDAKEEAGINELQDSVRDIRDTVTKVPNDLEQAVAPEQAPKQPS